MLKNISKLLNDINIKFVLSFKNLLEYYINKNIYDLDQLYIRFNIDDIKKLNNQLQDKLEQKYNLELVDNNSNIFTIKLNKYKDDLGCKEYPNININLYLISHFIENNNYLNYDINFLNLESTKYLEINTYIPNSIQIVDILKKEFGYNFIENYKLINPFNNKEKRIITFGTYDLFHYGHLKIIERAKKYFDNVYLIVGISTDNLNYKKKNKNPIIKQEQRLEIIKNFRYVNEVFYEESLEYKVRYCLDYNADILIMGDDHINEYNFIQKYGIQDIYLPRTKFISTTEILEKIRRN